MKDLSEQRHEEHGRWTHGGTQNLQEAYALCWYHMDDGRNCNSAGLESVAKPATGVVNSSVSVLRGRFVGVAHVMSGIAVFGPRDVVYA